MAQCDLCYEERAITHLVTSCVLKVYVCADCALRAYEIQERPGHVGAITVTPLEITLDRKTRT